MAQQALDTRRSGQTPLSPSNANMYELVLIAEDRFGSVDRVIGHLRRRRANMRALTMIQTENQGEFRISVTVNDADVEVEQLASQLRKIVDVRFVEIHTVEKPSV